MEGRSLSFLIVVRFPMLVEVKERRKDYEKKGNELKQEEAARKGKTA